MGQQYLAGAILSHFENVHVQSFDLPTLLSDSTRVSNVLGISLCRVLLMTIIHSPPKRLLFSCSQKFGDTSLV